MQVQGLGFHVERVTDILLPKGGCKIEGTLSSRPIAVAVAQMASDLHYVLRVLTAGN